MVERLKRWESPRRQGRNDKGKGGSARQRQLQKRQQMLRQKLNYKTNPKKAMVISEEEILIKVSFFF
jgi:hypothetical protein